jgi:hypothetical protein
MHIPFKNFFEKVSIVFFTFVIIFSVGISLASVDVEASLPNIITKHPYPIDPDREEPITVFFHYGNPSYDRLVQNVTAKVEIKGNGLKILPGSVNDLYHVEEENGRPKIPSCNEAYDGVEYQVDENLIKETSFRYGLQTAIKKDSSSGEEIGSLDPYSSGCIKFKVAVNDAKAGDLAEITFDQNSNLSENYDSANRPGKQIIKIRFAKGGECSSNQEFVLGSCVDPCEENKVRNLLGECEVLKDTCEEGYEKFGDLCVEKCDANQVRDGFGDCVSEGDISNPFEDSEFAGICLTEDCENEEQEATFEDALILILIISSIVVILGFSLKVFSLIRSKD